MHDPEKSDSGRVAAKPTNKAGRPAAEPVEPRPGAKGNADQQSTHRTQSRERKTLVGERVEHVNRIKGLLFAQGVSDYEPLKRNRRARLEELKTGDGRPLPAHLKAQISRELDRLELVLPQLRAVLDHARLAGRSR